jgi:hypothetical protein
MSAWSVTGVKTVPCLRCAEEFASDGKGNRLCKPCVNATKGERDDSGEITIRRK